MQHDPVDPRYSLANERTFLAWIRTALGLLAVSAAVLTFDLPWPGAAVRAVAAVLAALAGLSSFLAWQRWSRVETAIAAGRAVPPARSHLWLALAVAAIAVVVAVLAVT